MNDNSFTNHVSDRREARRQRRGMRRGGEWVLGLLLIVMAVVLLMQNMKVVVFTNWWALFILLPAFGSFGTAWRLTQEAGRFTARARGAAFLGVMLVVVTVLFLLQINWGIVGPGLLVLAGLGLFLNSLLPD